MQQSKTTRIIIPIVCTLFCIGALVAAFFIGINMVKKEAKSLEAERERIEADYEALHEENTDPVSGKTILTKAYMDKEYRSYYAGVQSSSRSFKMIVILLLLAFAGVAVICTIADAIMSIAKQRTMRLKGIVTALLAIGLVIGASVFLKKVNIRKQLPKPEEATVNLYRVNVAKKHENTETKYDNDGDKTTKTTYYLDLVNPDGTTRARVVPSSVYYDVTTEGYYYLAQYEGNGTRDDFAIYPDSEYIAVQT